MKRTVYRYINGAPPEFKSGDNGGRVRRMPKAGRNDPCYCGSGVKLKKCCTNYVTAVKKFMASIKGVHDGNCNREDCQKPHAIWFNHSTGKYYCGKCAMMLNTANHDQAMEEFGHDLCTLREEDS